MELSTAMEALRPPARLRMDVEIRVAGEADTKALTKAMGTSDQAVRRRLRAGNRCYFAILNQAIVSYGWVAYADVAIPELERMVHPHGGEAYIWDCFTLPSYRGRGYLPAILGHIAQALRSERFLRAWAAIVAGNVRSERAFRLAGFAKAMDVVYLRVLSWRYLRILPEGRLSAVHVRAAQALLGVESPHTDRVR